MRVAILILNVVGFLLSLPNTLCASACAGCLAGMGRIAELESGQSAGGLPGILLGATWVIFLICLAAFVLGFIAYAKPKTALAMVAGVVLIVAGLTQLAFVAMGLLLGLVAGLCLIVAGILAFIAKPEPHTT